MDKVDYLAFLKFGSSSKDMIGEVTSGSSAYDAAQSAGADITVYGNTPDEARFKAEQIARSRLSIKWR